MIICGIDVGVTGALAAVDTRGTASIHDLPITQDDQGKRLSARAMLDMLRAAIPAGEYGLIVMENIHVQAMHGRMMSHSTETTLVGLRFAIQALADVARLKVHYVTPQTWKKFYGIKGDKKGSDARSTASALYPLQAHKISRVRDHNRAEAILIARYGYEEFA